MNVNIFLIMCFFMNFLPVANSQNLDRAKTRVHKLFQKEVRKKNVHNAFLLVHSDRMAYHWNLVGGSFQNGEPVTSANRFHSASIGKTFTATLVAMLVEEGRLRFSDGLSAHLPPATWQGLHVHEGVDHSADITIAQLLQHTSGLADYFEDVPESGPSMQVLLVEQPERHWTPTQLLEFARDQLKPHFPPGTDYRYTDTEYILLGLIIEAVTGTSLHQVLEERIFQPLDMDHTSMHLRSEPLQATEAPMAELYLGTLELSHYQSLSMDWAGGGLLTTSEDLNRFQVALQAGELVSEDMLARMQAWTPESKGSYYGYGLRQFRLKELFFLLPNLTLLGHSGVSGAFMYYCPELEVYLSGTFNQTEHQKEHVVFLMKVLVALKKHANPLR